MTTDTHAQRMLAAIQQVLDAAGSRPPHGLLITAARRWQVDPRELADRLLAVLVEAHAARRWLAEGPDDVRHTKQAAA